MSAYATESEYEDYAGTDAPSDVERLLEKASDDVDTVLGTYRVLEDGDFAGRKIDPETLDYPASRALKRATCAQAQYRLEMGEAFFIQPSIASSGPEFSLEQPASHIGPLTWRELAGSGLLRNMTSVSERPSSPPWLGFAVNLD